MRPSLSTAAKALNSIALRYRHPLAQRSSPPSPGKHAASVGTAKPTPETAASPSARSPLLRDPELATLEAVLFVAHEPLNLRKIAQFARLADATAARTLIRRLNQLYDLAGCAFRVEEVAGGFRLLTRRKFGGWLRRLHQSSVEVRLSAPALETLAVIAYRQPVLRAAIESIRGVQCGELLRQLMERDIVRIVGRSEELGRPFLYGTTKRFLQVFGLRDLNELPRADYLRAVKLNADPELTETDSQQESSDVSVATTEPATPELLEEERRRRSLIERAEDEEDDDFEDDDDDLDDDEDDDLDDDEDDDEDEEDEEFDDDFDDDDWEEVDDDEEEDEDEDEDDDLDEDEDDDWDDDEDDDWDDDEEEEEEDEAV
ncbi:MAG: SMC-Scp complex subunit ScpB [Planctomycetaceae bacterium]|nr:SMC-Scp complex subunit ScpB [Planctomycetaceae bacterium]